MTCPLDEQTIQRLFALWADSAQALANNDPVNVAEVRAKSRAILRETNELAREYDVTSAAARMLLKLAAQHLDAAEQARNSVLRARHTRLAMRVLDRLERKPQEKLNAFDEYLKDTYGVTR
jgi:hypothetical protein